MPRTPAKQIFIIHGHDAPALDTLIRFIKSLGLKHLAFEKVADDLDDANPFIADVVRAGIERADAVLALFTPDEQAALYSSESRNLPGRDKTRWQARPNVIFEAGVALGIAEKKTILVTLGSNIGLFSDISGMHFIDLTTPNAKERLRRRLSRVLGTTLKPNRSWRKTSNEFQACLRKRWEHYDELEELESELRNTAVYGLKRSLFDVVQGIALVNRGTSWEKWTSDEFTRAICKKYDHKQGESANSAYYYLIVNGFLAFNDIDPWWEPRCGEGDKCNDYWENSVKFSRLTPRAIRLLYKIQRLAEP